MKTPIKLADQAVPLGTSGVRYTALVGLLSLALFTTATAADFTGSLNSVSITDSAGANRPPSAVINYTKDGNTFVFDASKSSDPDGSIAKYSWDLGDSTQASGVTAAHNYATAGAYYVTLTVVDDKGGSAITQLRLNTSFDVLDNFDTATTANYSAINGSLSINSGVATGTSNYNNNYFIHMISTGSANHFAQADIKFITANGSGVIVGASSANSSATGYIVAPISLRSVQLWSFNGSKDTNTNKTWNVSLKEDTYATIKVIKTGTTFSLYINGTHITPDITDLTYLNGEHAGIAMMRYAGYNTPVDNFSFGKLP